MTVSPKSYLEVRLSMKAELEGGRHGPFTAGYCPYFEIPGQKEWLAVRATRTSGSIAPGKPAVAVFQLLYPERVNFSALQPGISFSVLEGPREVANGTLISIHRDITDNSFDE